MANWTVTEDGLNYVMEYPNGFKRSIRKSQVTKNEKGALLEYASSQKPYQVLASNTYSITSYLALISQIGFTNNGGDDWTFDFKIVPDSVQIPAGQTIDSYDANIVFYVAGGGTSINLSTETTDFSKTTTGNGAGVYYVEQVYNVFEFGVPIGSIIIQSIYKVDGAGNILAYYKGQGVTVNSTNGRNINVNAAVQQSQSYPLQWYSYNDIFTPTLIGTGNPISLLLPNNCAYLIAQPVLDLVFTNDLPVPLTVVSKIKIN
jgi:hypothetical protein